MNYVFIHGLGQTPASWDKVFEHLSAEITPRCPFFLSDMVKGQTITYETLYRAFSEKSERLQGPLCLCGVSLGAVMALHYAINEPQRIKSLILIAPQYKMPRLLLSIQNIIFRLMPQKKFKETGFSKHGMLSLTNTMKRLDLTPLLKHISCPVLILCGEKDVVNKKAARTLTACISGAKLLFLENAGHEVNSEVPAALARIINEFWCK